MISRADVLRSGIGKRKDERWLSPQGCMVAQDSAALLVAVGLFILWILSLWLLFVERRRPTAIAALQPFPLLSGTILFFILSVASLLFLRLLLRD
jgi:uncharacterized membrane protein